MISTGLISSACLFCAEREEWDYIIQCRAIGEKQKQFITKLHNKLRKISINKEQKQESIDILSDIAQYLSKWDRIKTTQQIIGIEKIFWGIIIEN